MQNDIWRNGSRKEALWAVAFGRPSNRPVSQPIATRPGFFYGSGGSGKPLLFFWKIFLIILQT